MSTLAIVPAYMTEPSDLELTSECLRSLRKTQPALEVLIVDDHSPAPALVDELEAAVLGLEMELQRKDENEGFARTVNVGLRRALDEGKDAVLVNADVEFYEDGWLERMQRQSRHDSEEPAEVVGALLLYPNGLIQHAGIFFSLLHRCFDHRFRYGPQDLAEAHHAFRCPVTGALQFIRHKALTEVGLYDENFRLGWEDVDFVLRIFQAGGDCIYQPKVRAIHHESMFRGRQSPKVADWTAKSWIYFMTKHAQVSFAEWIPTWI